MSAGVFDPSNLPAPESVRRRHLALVLVDEAIAGPDGEFRCYYGDQDGYLLTFSNGSGDEYRLVFTSDDEAVLSLFDHESPYSPWSHPATPVDWPGMFDGLPPHLAGHLPAREGPEWPRAITACCWFTKGRWQTGAPAAPPQIEGWADAQGVRGLLAPILDGTGGEVRRYVEEYWERSELTGAAIALFHVVDHAEPVTEAHFTALGASDAGVLVDRARGLDL
jgi:hypothetical protein